MKRILILAGAAVLLVLAVVLVLRDRGEGGTRSALVDTPAATPTSAAPAPSTDARRPLQNTKAPGASTTTASLSGTPDARVAPATADAPTVPWLAPVPWEQIPLDTAMGETLGDFASRKEFSKAMSIPRVMPICDSSWTHPPGLKELHLKVELRVQAEGNRLVVEDAKVIDANVADNDLAACVEASYRGRRIDVVPANPNARYRIRWEIAKGYDQTP